MWMQHLGIWARGDCGGDGLAVGLDELEDLCKP